MLMKKMLIKIWGTIRKAPIRTVQDIGQLKDI